ncbi:class I SAM-dependent methyltransferase [Candidatus Kaiserbacteria bacterium]|nr:class I SAM-dependent methyltransferase [Candidatus Kaiserbacteria bacterium]
MKYDQHLTTRGWGDYELLDSGENMKLERFGSVVLARPETEALWAKRQLELWEKAHAEFKFEKGKGKWHLKKEVPESWELTRGPLHFLARLTSFKHTGIFPEQEPNWVWIKDRVKQLGKPNVLNLFGYTGIASLSAAHPGAFVTHVDASKQSLDWAHENARLSGIGENAIRWILDDAFAFAKREVRRSAKYEGIVLDPPAFGRGAKGEVWHIEEHLPKLLAALRELLSDTPGSFFLVSGYAAGYASLSFVQAVESTFGKIDGESGELRIAEANSDRAIPAGVYVRFIR